MKLIQSGNTKLHNCYMFNLPASHEVCGRLCSKCYAHREQVRFPSVLSARTDRYLASLQPNFPQQIISELSKLQSPPKWFRIHASGEFYSQAYVDSWYTICSNYPTIGFYAYTKRLKDFDFSKLKALPNMALINSYHFGSVNYGPLSSAPSKAFICPSSKSIRCGIECTYCMTKQAQHNGVYFHVH